MRAVAYRTPGEASELVDVELPEPEAPRGHDLLVEVRAVAVNPVDIKVRRGTAPADGQLKVLGWDAAGVVRDVGDDATGFAPGDRVWYAGSLVRPGCTSQRHLVDSRIVAHAPTTLDFPAAAAMPLTSLTAAELLFDRLGVAPASGHGQSLLIVGAAGGVGSMLTQLAAQLTGLHVIGTASRPESAAHVSDLGAHEVIDHHQPLRPQLEALGVPTVDLIASLTGTQQHFPALADVVSPQGRIGIIDSPEHLDVTLLKPKSASLHWEFMFTRSMFGTADMIEQQRLLTRIAQLVDDGVLRSTMTVAIAPIEAATVREAHGMVESGRSIGKVVLDGWPE